MTDADAVHAGIPEGMGCYGPDEARRIHRLRAIGRLEPVAFHPVYRIAGNPVEQWPMTEGRRGRQVWRDRICGQGMAKITHVDICMVDLVPKVKRTDAIQSFVSQETPLVTITDADGAKGTGYCYTIGTGGPAVISLLRTTLVPQLIGREAEEIERIQGAGLSAVATRPWYRMGLGCHRKNPDLRAVFCGRLPFGNPPTPTSSLYRRAVFGMDP